MTAFTGPYYYHQLGFNDHLRCLTLIQDGIGYGAIFSPDNFQGSREHLFEENVQKYREADIDLLIDPQGYDPNSIQSEDDLAGDESTIFRDEVFCVNYNRERLDFQLQYNVSSLIVPGYETDDLSENWKEDIPRFAVIAAEYLTEREFEGPLYSTVAVNQSLVRSQDRRQELLNVLANLKDSVDGIYLIIVNAPTFTEDVQLLMGMLDLVFNLKWQGFSVLLGYSGPWAMLAFPFGLDRFANSGLKNRQIFTTRREEQPPGWGPPGGKQYHDYFSLDLMSFLRYPDDFRGLSTSERMRILSRKTAYSPPEDRDPDVVKEAKLWERGTSYQDFSAKMARTAAAFQGKTLEERIATVRIVLEQAAEERQRLADLSTLDLSPHVLAWSEAFENYLEQVRDDLEFEFGWRS